MARQVDVELGRAEVLLSSLAVSPSLRDGALVAFQTEAAVAAANARLGDVQIELLNALGQPLVRVGGTGDLRSGGGKGGVQAASSTRDLIAPAQRALESGRIEWSNFEIDPATGARSIVGYLALSEAKGLVRLLGIVVPLDIFQAILTNQRLPEGRVAAVLDPTGVVVARSYRADELVGKPATRPVIAALESHDEGVFESLVNQDGVTSVVAYTRAPRSRYSVVIAAPHEEFLSPLRQALVRNLGVGALVVLCAVAGAYAIARRLIKALNHVALTETSAKHVVDSGLSLHSTGLAETDALASRLAVASLDRSAAIEALRQTDRRKDEFLAMLGHELRNPLSPLTTALRLIECSDPSTPVARQAMEIAQRQTAQLRRLVDDLLEVSRINQGRIALRIERMDLAVLVRDVVVTLSSDAARRSQSIDLSTPDAPCTLNGDPLRLSQVFLNLVGNAIKYTPDHGRIVVSVHPLPNCIETRIADNGIGIDPAELSRIFELFHQADTTLDRASGGLGIGLALVRRLVELHGGTVRATSAGKGQGAEFIVSLPTDSRQWISGTREP